MLLVTHVHVIFVRISVSTRSLCALELVRAVGGAEVVPGVPFFPEYNVDGEFHPIWYNIAGGERRGCVKLEEIGG
jgi:hypothetical protein